jgi:uncharacterized glyoxalase superfamily protein PhnB
VTYPQLCPYLYYENGAEAMHWLAKAFGFRERMRVAEDDGTIRHAEMELGDAVIMLGTPPGHKSPAHLGQVTVGMYVRVDDVDAHYERAKTAGADIENEPTNQDYGDRSYGVRDLEGHQWWFYTPVS